MTDRIVTKEGRNAVRDALLDVITEAAVGTGDSTPRAGDTALDNEVFRGELSNSAEDTGEIQSSLRLGTGDANGEILNELMLHTDDRSFARIVFSDTEKSDDIELEFEVTVRNENP